MEQAQKTFKTLYDALPPGKKNAMGTQIIERCNISLWTLQSWLSGRRHPKARSKEIIAEIFEMSVSELFPESITN